MSNRATAGSGSHGRLAHLQTADSHKGRVAAILAIKRNLTAELQQAIQAQQAIVAELVESDQQLEAEMERENARIEAEELGLRARRTEAWEDGKRNPDREGRPSCRPGTLQNKDRNRSHYGRERSRSPARPQQEKQPGSREVPRRDYYRVQPTTVTPSRRGFRTRQPAQEPLHLLTTPVVDEYLKQRQLSLGKRRSSFEAGFDTDDEEDSAGQRSKRLRTGPATKYFTPGTHSPCPQRKHHELPSSQVIPECNIPIPSIEENDGTPDSWPHGSTPSFSSSSEWSRGDNLPTESPGHWEEEERRASSSSEWNRGDNLPTESPGQDIHADGWNSTYSSSALAQGEVKARRKRVTPFNWSLIQKGKYPSDEDSLASYTPETRPKVTTYPPAIQDSPPLSNPSSPAPNSTNPDNGRFDIPSTRDARTGPGFKRVSKIKAEPHSP